MPKFDVTSSHGLGGGQFCDVGDVIEIADPQEAQYRLRIGLVLPHADDAAPPPATPIADAPAVSDVPTGPDAPSAVDAPAIVPDPPPVTDAAATDAPPAGDAPTDAAAPTTSKRSSK